MKLHYRQHPTLMSMAHFLLGLIIVLGPVSARADIVADQNAPASQQATVLSAGNGIPLVNIQTPSAAGVSRNSYRQFDVNSSGAILNNGHSDSQTQLAGWVQANPHLAGGTAKIILNEVNAGSASNLNGYLEVAGDKAQVVVANPAGISCSGCGFINASRATLSTGTAQMSNGQLQGYNVQDGQISVTGAGLDSGSAGYTDLIARAVQVNSGIWADHLNVVAGTGNVGADGGTLSGGNGDGNVPTVAIDVSQLGGMYANSIRLLGTGAGVGVRNAGTIGSAAGEVVVSADGKIENTGSGKIYGDHLALEASTLDNIGNGTTAPVIAAGGRLDIGVETLNNREQALIHGGGDLAIGGSLDSHNQATGQAGTVNNVSATLEAQGNLTIAAHQINNTNEHLVTADVQVANDHIVEYSGSGSGTRYTPDQVHFTTQDKATYLVTPEGTYHDWNQYDYTRTVTATQVVETAPAQLTAGGNLTLSADTVINRDSHILAGGDLNVSAGTLDNQETLGMRTSDDNGQVTHANRGTYCAKKVAGYCVNKDYKTHYSSTGYHATTQVDEHLNQLQTDANAGNIQLPTNGLFNINPAAPNGYLIETDPQFTHYRDWLSSDYLLRQMAVDPALTQMRLGDGYYEQQRVREQMAELTGRRFLEGYSDDEAQYRALMDAGVTFAKAHDIVPGIALTAAQVAQMTSDIVWLVEETVTLADGSRERVLVPKLYVLVKDNGINPRGALVAADNIHMNLSGDLSNHGTIAANNVTALTADNLHNIDGAISGRDTRIQVNTDLNNVGGAISAEDSLDIQAGRDINLTSTTRTQENTQGGSTRIDRIAGLYVSSGTLLAGAGRDLNLTGAAIVNDTLTLHAERLGNTQLSAGHDFVLNSIQENEQQRIVWDPQTLQTDTRISATGTRIKTRGDLSLQAGNDLTGSASQIRTREGNVDIDARHDLNLAAATDEQHSNASSRTSTARTESVSHNLAGIDADGNVSLHADHDLSLTGTRLNAGGDVKLGAGNDTRVAAAVDSRHHYDTETQDAAFNGSLSATNETLSSTVSGGSINAGGNLLINTHKANGEAVSELSHSVNLAGVHFQSQGDTAIAADNGINVSGMQHDSADYHATRETGAYGTRHVDQGHADNATALQNARLTSTGNLQLQSGTDITLAAADVIADGNVNLDAVDALLISAGEILNRTEEWKNSSGLFTQGDLYHSRAHQAGTIVTGSQSSLVQAGGNVTANVGSAHIIGSDIVAGNNIDVQADSGTLDITAARTTTQRYRHDKEVSVSLGSLGEKLLRPDQMVTTHDGRLTVKLADAHYDQHDNQSTQTDMRGSRLISNNDINLNASAGDINVTGSDLSADAGGNNNGDLTLSSATGIHVQQATGTYEEQNKDVHAEGEVSFVVQHQAVEVVKAYQNLEDAKEQLEQAKRDYRDYQRNLDHLESQLKQLETDYANHIPGVNYDDLLELRDLIKNAKDDKEWYVSGIALATVNLTSATTALLQQTAAAAQSAGTYGINAGLQFDADASKTSSEIQSTQAIASNLSGNNIVLQTGTASSSGDMDTHGTQTQIQGSNLLAGNTININTGTLDISASQNTRTSRDQSEHGHVTAQVTVYGASGGPSVNASFDRSKSSSRSTTNTNSRLLADSITIDASGDTDLRGATVRADSSLNVDVQGDLNVESVQDRSSSRNTSAGVSGGISLGGDNSLSGVNGGANSANGMSNTRQTLVTSLSSGGTANINVAGHTQITGAVIATTDNDGNDLNQLNLSTGSLTYTDLRDSNVSSQTSTGLSTSVGIGNAKPTDNKTNTATNANGKELLPGTSNLTYSNSQQNSATKTLATLGHGNITVGGTQLEQDGQLTDAGSADTSALDGMNRDSTHTSKDLWSSDYHQDLDVTLDHRLVTPDGHQAIKDDIQHIGILGDSVKDLKQSSVSLLGLGEGESSLRENILNREAFFNATKIFASDPANAEYVKTLTSGVASPAQKDAAYTALANSLAQQLGLDPVKALTLVQDTLNLDTRPYDGTDIHQIIQGAYAQGTQGAELFLVDDNIGNTSDAVGVLGHEVSHYADAGHDSNAAKTQAYRNNRENYADIMGTATVDYLNYNLEANDYSTLGATNTHNGSNIYNPTVAANNARFNQLDQSQVDYRQLAIPEIQYVRDNDRVQHFVDYLHDTTGQRLTPDAARARLLQGAAGLMDEHWQRIYGTDARVMDFLMTEVADDIKKVTTPANTEAAREQNPALLQQELLNSNLAYNDPRTGERRLVFGLAPGEHENERIGVVDFMARDNLDQIWDLMVQKTPEQRQLDNLLGQNRALSNSANSNLAVSVWNAVAGMVEGTYHLITSPIDTSKETIEGVKELNAYGTLLEFEGRDEESGYIIGDGNAQVAMGMVVGEGIGSLGQTLLQGALKRAKGGKVTVTADATGQATGIEIGEAPVGPIGLDAIPKKSLVQTHNSNLAHIDSEFGPQLHNSTVSSRIAFDNYVSEFHLTFKEGWSADRVYDEVINVPLGGRPEPTIYLSNTQIDAHLSTFDEGAVRFTSRDKVEKYGTAGTSEAFVLPKKVFDQIVAESKGDLRQIEKKLGLDQGYLGNSDTMAVYIQPQDIRNIHIPSGNEAGANGQWIPGGYTNGGVPEAVIDLSDTPFSEISIK